MKTIHCNPTVTATIPRHLQSLRITRSILEAKGACEGGVKAFKKRFPKGCTYLKLREEIASQGKQEYECWLLDNFGGDVATAGKYGTATAGYRGTATAGYRGTATAGYRGTATAGDWGTATAGDWGTATAGYRGTATAGDCGTAIAGDCGTATAGKYGTATAGYRGTATAGDWGTATAGEGGAVIIAHFDDEKGKCRWLMGEIGENGLEPNVPYKVEHGKFVRAN